MYLTETLEWAYTTLAGKLKFGLPEEQAIKRRETRVKGVLKEVIPKIEQLEADNEKLRECVEFYANTDSWTDGPFYFETCDDGDSARATLKEIDSYNIDTSFGDTLLESVQEALDHSKGNIELRSETYKLNKDSK